MKERIAKIKNSGVIKTLKEIMSSRFFPFITATIFLLCYYLGWDMVLVYYVSFCGILILLLLDDVTPLITILTFISVLITYKNSPSNIMLNSDYYLRTHNIIQVVMLLSIFFLTGAYRVVATFISKKIVISPMLYGLAAFSIALLFSGMFSNNYSFAQFLYGLALVLCFLFIFVGIKDNIKIDKQLFVRVSLNFVALGLLLVIELAVKYASADGIIKDGMIDRSKLVFGWGIWNTIGTFIVMCIPPVFYLARVHKFGYIFTAFATVLFIASLLSCSRQAIIAGVIIYLTCIVLLLLCKRHRIANICIFIASFAVMAIIALANKDTIKYFIELFKNLISGNLDGNGRKGLWKQAIIYFKSAPVFGVGFFVHFANDPHFANISFVPLMAHNTVFELLSACGIVGLATYAFHRIQTIISFFKNATFERLFIALTIASILITSLFDNHIFYIFPTIIYSCLLAVFVALEQKEQKMLTINE